jgi:hypothetical protein
MSPKLLTPEQVSEWLNMPLATLTTLRNAKRAGADPLPFVKLPSGRIRYREDQVRKWIERHTFEAACDAKK